MYVGIYACVCMLCVYVNVHACVYMCRHLCRHACVYVYVHVYVYVDECMYACVYVCECMCMNVYVCACMRCMYVRCMCTYVYVCVHVCGYLYVNIYVCMCVCVCACMCVCVYVCWHACVYVCWYVHMHVFMCVHNSMCGWIYAGLSSIAAVSQFSILTIKEQQTVSENVPGETMNDNLGQTWWHRHGAGSGHPLWRPEVTARGTCIYTCVCVNQTNRICVLRYLYMDLCRMKIKAKRSCIPVLMSIRVGH